MTTDCKRNGNKWTTNEILTLQREYELLEWSAQKIALKHKRSVKSILFKLHSEGISSSFYEPNLCGPQRKRFKAIKEAIKGRQHEDTYDNDDDNDSSSDYEDEDEDEEEDEEEDEDKEDDKEEEANDTSVDKIVDKFSKRVWKLETSVGEINNVLKQLFDHLTDQQKLAPLKKSTIQEK